MSNITYSEQTTVTVKLDGRVIGHIKSQLWQSGRTFGYCYFPKGSKTGGDVFPTLAACKASLESDN